VMLGRLVNDVLKDRPPSYPWGSTFEVLKRADGRICNLESVLSDRGEPWSATPKAFHFRSDAKNIEVLKVAKINAVALANNHALDFGHQALTDTLGLLDKAGIAHVGAGRNLEVASQPAVVNFGKLKLAMLAITDNEPAWAATQNQPGIWHVPIDRKDSRAQQLFNAIRKAKTNFDLVVVSAHWGGNWGYEPEPEQLPFAHYLIKAGADIIFGHSPHVVRGIEIYQGQPILYSAGDFVDDYAVDEAERNDESFIFLVDYDGNQPLQLRLIPTMIANFQAQLAKFSQAEAIAKKMQRLCQQLGTEAIWNTDSHQLHIAV
ncbi:CapA family protein, partial [Candidatus Microgenomates bacterium]|nr:CapA family protein [Candidatus Microgenomates bacterium]